MSGSGSQFVSLSNDSEEKRRDEAVSIASLGLSSDEMPVLPRPPSRSGRCAGPSWWAALSRTVRTVVIVCVLVVLFVIFAVVFKLAIGRNDNDEAGDCLDGSNTAMEAALCVHDVAPMIDGHNDLPWSGYRPHEDNLTALNLRDDLSGITMTDIPRLRKGKVGGQFWSVYVPCSMQHKDAVRSTLEQIDLVHGMVEQYPDTFQLATTAADITNAHENGKIASLIGIEGGHQIDSSLGALRMMYMIGARYMTLTHACDTPWAASSHNDKGEGLTDFGRKIVREMNRLGMLVDISHVSEQTMNDALDETVSPVIASHSSAFSICGNPRNVPDSVLAKVADNGGVIMVNFYPPYVTCSNVANVTQVADHVDWIVSKAGIDHVGYGADFDGIGILPEGLTSVADFPALTAELISRGHYDQQDLEKIIGGNLIRVLKANEVMAAKLQAAGVTAREEGMIFPNVSCRTMTATGGEGR